MKYFHFILFLFPSCVFAQGADIQGHVSELISNKPLAGVTVSIANTSYGSTTDSAGDYHFSNLQPGIYNLQFSSVGYRPKAVFEVQVSNLKAVVVDVNLEQDANTLKEVKVYSPRFNKTLESPLSEHTIGATEIKRNPGGNRDISKVIQSLPGVGSPVSFRNDIIIRGGAPDENKFYLNGIEIPNINHFTTQGSSGGPIGLINVDFIKEVDFYSGAFPADRGNALSSVFEFKQKDGRSDKADGTLTVGSNDFSATLEGPLGRKTTFISSYRYSFLQYLFKAFGLPFLPAYQDFQFKLKTKFDAKNEFTILGLGAIDRFKINLAAGTTEANRYILSNIPVNSQNDYTIGATYKNYRSKGYSLFVMSHDYLSNATYKYQNNDPSLTKTINYRSTETENKFRFENVSQENGFRINFGIGAETADYYTNTDNKLPFGNMTYTSGISFFKYNLFGQVSRPLFKDKLSLSVGLRLDANTFANQMNNLVKTFSPRFSASYNLSDKFSINFNTGIYYQLPSYTVLGFRDSTGTLINKGVQYISNKQLVLGIEYNTLKNARFTIEGFYKFYQHYPMERVLGDTVSIANLGADYGVIGNAPLVGYSDGRSYGIEFFGQQRLSKGFYWLFALTVFKSEFDDKHGNYVQSSWNSRYILSVTGGKIFKNNWELGTKLRYTGGSPYTPYNINTSSLKSNYTVNPQGIPDYNLLNTKLLGAFYQIDARLDKKYPFKKFNLNFYLDLQNITGNQYESQQFLVADRTANGDEQDLPGDATRIKTKLLTNKAGNITPTIGVILDF
jgi:CarboxypepD_reg-like domain/TonB-dependent Receptor Plug Domain